MEHFKLYNKQDILSFTKMRRFETKIGERVEVCLTDNLPEALEKSKSTFVVFGIPEDIGVKANYGIGGADTAWVAFLSSFLNLQSNDFLEGSEILLLGHFEFSSVDKLIEGSAVSAEERIEAFRHAVNLVDNEVEKVANIIAAAGKIPIAIGGGHNNSYPLLKGTAKGLRKRWGGPVAQLNCINLDAHTDYRPLEGRHSGNGFRYAEADGYLGKYAIIAVHESYVPQNVLAEINANPFVKMISYEDIYLHERLNFIQAVSQATAFTEDNYCGVELDVDSIEYALGSAATPCGVSPVQARQYLSFVATDVKIAYLHICEGAAYTDNGIVGAHTGKLLSYLVSDFIKAKNMVK